MDNWIPGALYGIMGLIFLLALVIFSPIIAVVVYMFYTGLTG